MFGSTVTQSEALSRLMCSRDSSRVLTISLRLEARTGAAEQASQTLDSLPRQSSTAKLASAVRTPDPSRGLLRSSVRPSLIRCLIPSHQLLTAAPGIGFDCLRHTSSAKSASLSPPRLVRLPAVFFFSSSAPVHCHIPAEDICTDTNQRLQNSAVPYFFFFLKPTSSFTRLAPDVRNKYAAFSFGPSQVCGSPSANNGLSRQLHCTAPYALADYAEVCASLPLHDSEVTEQQRQQTCLSIPGKVHPALIACL